jgi:uncharacterized protein with HEPN domain
MSGSDEPRAIEKIVGDMLDTASAATEIVARGRDAWDRDRLLRLAGEAVINRIGDAASRLPDEVRAAMTEVPWDDIRANRVLVAHIYHRIDYTILWETLARDVPRLPTSWNAGGRYSSSATPDSRSGSDVARAPRQGVPSRV